MALTYEQKFQILDSLRRNAHREVAVILHQLKTESLVTWLDGYVRSHGYRRNWVFECAVIPAKYGYKLFSGEKRFTSRNQLLRLCLAVRMKRADIDHTLKLAGMNPLDDENARDTLIIVGVEDDRSLGTINEWLTYQEDMDDLFADSP